MRQSGSTLLVCALILLMGTLAPAGDEQKIKLDDLPKAVKATVKKLYPDAKLISASKETAEDDEDETIYEVELKVDGKSVDLTIDDEGELEEIEKEIDADDLPRAVTRAAVKRFPNGKITKVEEVTDEDDKVVYELAIKTEGKETEVVMAPNGKILAIEGDDDDEDGKKEGEDKDDKKGKKKAKKEKKDKDDDDDDKKKDKDDDDKKDKKDDDGKKQKKDKDD